LARMQQLVRAAIADGACGASTGLEYTPGAFAPRDELIALCKPLAARRLPYATHMRNEDDRLIEAIDEAIAVARGVGCPLQISHLKTQGPRNWGKLDTAFARVAAARAAGCDAAFDRYPYIAYQTGLTNLFPVWSRDGSTAAFLGRLTDPSTADKIKQETLAKVELIGGWDNVMIANVATIRFMSFSFVRQNPTPMPVFHSTCSIPAPKPNFMYSEGPVLMSAAVRRSTAPVA